MGLIWGGLPGIKKPQKCPIEEEGEGPLDRVNGEKNEHLCRTDESELGTEPGVSDDGAGDPKPGSASLLESH